MALASELIRSRGAGAPPEVGASNRRCGTQPGAALILGEDEMKGGGSVILRDMSRGEQRESRFRRRPRSWRPFWQPEYRPSAPGVAQPDSGATAIKPKEVSYAGTREDRAELLADYLEGDMSKSVFQRASPRCGVQVAYKPDHPAGVPRLRPQRQSNLSESPWTQLTKTAGSSLPESPQARGNRGELSRMVELAELPMARSEATSAGDFEKTVSDLESNLRHGPDHSCTW